MPADDRPARVEDLHELALGMPHAPHFDGHRSVLVRTGRLAEVSLRELREVVQDAWLAQASPRRCEAWLADRPARQLRPDRLLTWANRL